MSATIPLFTYLAVFINIGSGLIAFIGEEELIDKQAGYGIVNHN